MRVDFRQLSDQVKDLSTALQPTVQTFKLEIKDNPILNYEKILLYLLPAPSGLVHTMAGSTLNRRYIVPDFNAAPIFSLRANRTYFLCMQSHLFACI